MNRCLCALILLMVPFPAYGADDPGLQAILKRLEALEQDNRQLREELRKVQQELTESRTQAGPPAIDERVEVQERRADELAQTKVEASQHFPVSLTGMLLFNAFHNGRFSNTFQDPLLALSTPTLASSGASLRQTVLGLKFAGPDLPWGGTASGSLYMDFYAGSRDPNENYLHIRTANLDLKWGNTTITVGQDKPIFAPREPDSLAQVSISPLSGAGNLWDWQPQVRIEQRIRFSEQSQLRAQFGVYQTEEGDATTPTAFTASLEHARPGYEGRLEWGYGGVNHRFEIAPGFHFSATHVAGTSVPSRVVSLDWLARPFQMVQLTGAWYRGENVANLGALRQGFTVLGPQNVIPIHSTGGWSQVTVFLMPRLTFHAYGGEERDRASDLIRAGVRRNFVYAGNVVYRIAPNVLASFEASQARTVYLGTGLRLNNHYDLALAYLF